MEKREFESSAWTALQASFVFSWKHQTAFMTAISDTRVSNICWKLCILLRFDNLWTSLSQSLKKPFTVFPSNWFSKSIIISNHDDSRLRRILSSICTTWWFHSTTFSFIYLVFRFEKTHLSRALKS